MTRSRFPEALIAGVLLFGCAPPDFDPPADTSDEAPAEDPRIVIFSPEPSQEFLINEDGDVVVPMIIALENALYTDPAAAETVPEPTEGQAHVHVFQSDPDVYKPLFLPAEDYLIEDPPTGFTTLNVQLMNNDHTAYLDSDGNEIFALVEINIQEAEAR